VDGIERTYENRLIVIRLNIQEPVSRALAERFDFRFTPTFVFIDAAGNELWRQVGTIDPQEVQRSLEAP
jgi:thioredoxin-related protein